MVALSAAPEPSPGRRLGEYETVSLKLTLRLLERREGGKSIAEASAAELGVGPGDWACCCGGGGCCRCVFAGSGRDFAFSAEEAEEDEEEEEDEADAGRRCASGPVETAPSSLDVCFQNGAIVGTRLGLRC